MEQQVFLSFFTSRVLFLSLLLSLSDCAIQYDHTSPPERILYSSTGERISGFKDTVDKDVILGGLFPVHVSQSMGGQCSDRFRSSGFQRLEAMLFAIDSINSNSSLLPGMSLGYDIRDTCVSENIALDESIDFVFESDQLEMESCSSMLVGNASERVKVSSVIGASSSSVSIPVASLLRLFRVPQISYASSSSSLNNRDRYEYFLRTVPPDNQQAMAMIDLIERANWNFVSTIYSDNLYGEPGINQFHELAHRRGICIDLNLPIKESFLDYDYQYVADRLANSTANVTVLFTSFEHADMLLRTMTNTNRPLNKAGKVWIASDSSASTTLAASYTQVVSELWGVLPATSVHAPFDDYYKQLSTSNNKRNPWTLDAFRQLYNCAHNDCNVSSDYSQNEKVPLVIDAVYSIAYALKAFLSDKCSTPLVWHASNQSCQSHTGGEAVLNGSVLLQHLMNVSFTSPTGNEVSFNENGTVKAIYNIAVLKVEQGTNNYELENVGYWNENLPIANRLQFYAMQNENELFDDFTSQCQKCLLGQFKRLVTSSCCGTCDPCLGSNYTNTSSSTMCMTCPDNMWGNNPLTGNTHCIDIDESYLKPSDAWGIVLIILAIIGLIAVVFVTSVFIWFWNTPIVKSSGREQMVLVLIGITLCFASTLFFLLKPSPAACGLQRIVMWFSYSLILCALCVKLIRITRIFMQKSTSSRPKFITPPYQIIFTFLLIAFQMTFVFISLLVVNPGVKKELHHDETNDNNFPTLILQCTTPHIAMITLQMLYNTALLITSNALAVVTIRFPANFNESRYVAFSTFSLGLMWFLFILSYVATNGSTIQTAVLSSTIQLSALSVLACLFGPRVFIMIFWPLYNSSESGMKPTMTNDLPQRVPKSQTGVPVE